MHCARVSICHVSEIVGERENGPTQIHKLTRTQNSVRFFFFVKTNRHFGEGFSAVSDRSPLDAISLLITITTPRQMSNTTLYIPSECPRRAWVVSVLCFKCGNERSTLFMHTKYLLFIRIVSCADTLWIHAYAYFHFHRPTDMEMDECEHRAHTTHTHVHLAIDAVAQRDEQKPSTLMPSTWTNGRNNEKCFSNSMSCHILCQLTCGRYVGTEPESTNIFHKQYTHVCTALRLLRARLFGFRFSAA